MDNAQPSTSSHSRVQLLFSPYLPGFLQGTLMVLLGAFIAGSQGLAAKIEPLLLDPKTSGLILLVWALSLVITMFRGMFADHQVDAHWSSLWLPIQTTLTAAALLPVSDGMSVLAKSMVWVMRLGAGL